MSVNCPNIRGGEEEEGQNYDGNSNKKMVENKDRKDRNKNMVENGNNGWAPPALRFSSSCNPAIYLFPHQATTGKRASKPIWG